MSEMSQITGGERRLSGKISRCMLVIVLLLIGVLTSCITAHCVDQTKVYIDPPTIEDPALGPGERFIINICIANVSDLAGYEFNMSYDTATLTCVGVAVGPTDNLPIPNWEVDDDIGNVWVNVTYGEPVNASSAVTVASLTFLVQSRGTSMLDLYYTNLIDSLGQPIPHEAFGGYFNNYSPYDLNKDGHVDIRDVVIVAIAFGTEEGDPGWDPRADVNGDGLVDIFDLVTLAIHFGET